MDQGWGAGAGRSRLLLAPLSRSRLKKIPGAGAGAAKKLALREDKKHKEIVLKLLFYRQNSKFL